MVEDVSQQNLRFTLETINLVQEKKLGMVLKTRLDRPVRSLVDHGSGSIRPIGLESDRTEIRSFERRSDWRTGQTERFPPDLVAHFPFPFLVWLVPPLSPGVSSHRQHPSALGTLPHLPLPHAEKPPYPIPNATNPVVPLAVPLDIGNPTPLPSPHLPAPCSGNLPTSPPKRCKSPSPALYLQSPVTPRPQRHIRKLSSTAKSLPRCWNLPKSLVFHFCFLNFNFDILYLISEFFINYNCSDMFDI